MNPVAVPENAKAAHPGHLLVSMGPPVGVSGEECGTAQMLIGNRPVMPGFGGHDQLAFFRPTEHDLAVLNAGGLLVMNQIGFTVQPFSLGVWTEPSHE
jgi:hypothetical protein